MEGRVAVVSIRKHVDKHYFLKESENFRYLVLSSDFYSLYLGNPQNCRYHEN